jgi:integrase
VTVSELIDAALEFTAHHKDNRNYKSKGEIVRAALGARHAAELTPQELERWLREHCKTAATANRYKAFISLCYREGVRNGKVSVNPARMVRQRKEGGGRLRFLSRDEYDKLHKIIGRQFPEHLAEFVVSIHTGMRLSEQYSCTWSQVHLDRRTIELTKTKNGSARAVQMNSDAIAALESLRRPDSKPPILYLLAKATRDDSTLVHGFSRAWKKRASAIMSGTATAIRSVHGWQWRGRASRKFRKRQVTRQ